MDFKLSDDLKAFQETIQRFCKEKVSPNVLKWEREGKFPREIYREMGKMGLFGCVFPEQYGGTNAGFLALVIAAEEVSRAWYGLSAGFNMQGMTVPFTILNWGTEEQRMKYVRPLIQAEMIGFLGLTEPGGGTDLLGATKTFAQRKGDFYILSGSKIFITFGSEADIGLVLAYTNFQKKEKGMTIFIIERGMEGFHSRRVPMIGFSNVMPTSELSFEDVKIPIENRLGEEGEGFKIAMNAVDHGRICVAARAVGLAQACLDWGIKYALERESFGQPIGRYQMIQRLLADFAVEVDAARLLTYRAAWIFDQQETPPNRETYRAKYYAGEVACRSAQAVSEIYGAYALAEEYIPAWFLQGAQLFRVGEGSANLQRILIAEDLLGWRKADRHGIKRKFYNKIKNGD